MQQPRTAIRALIRQGGADPDGDWNVLVQYPKVFETGARITPLQRNVPAPKAAMYAAGVVVRRMVANKLLITWWTVEDGRVQPDVWVLLDSAYKMIRGRINFFALGMGVLVNEDTIVEKCQMFESTAFGWEVDPEASIESIVPGGKFCSFCGGTNGVSLCSGCKQSMYCDRECQKNHRKIHRGFCDNTRAFHRVSREGGGFMHFDVTPQSFRHYAVSMFTPDDDL